jgi:biopolymer transport protein ExbD
MQIGASRDMNAELNVTPLIDVVLVLLIIFMVVVPKNDRQVPVVIPKQQAEDAPPPAADEESLVIELSALDVVSVKGNPVADLDALRRVLRASLTNRRDKVVFLDAADDASYDLAVRSMDAARRAGAQHVGLIEPPTSQR